MWYARAAKQGHPAAMNNLAIQYEEGRGVSRDGARARQLYEQAFRAGYRGAADNLARLLLSGKLGSPDTAAACQWLLAAKDDDPMSAKICGGLPAPALIAAKQRAAGLR
jgi:TPR repeat protein